MRDAMVAVVRLEGRRVGFCSKDVITALRVIIFFETKLTYFLPCCDVSIVTL